MISLPTALDVPLYTDDNGQIRVRGTRVLLELVVHAFKQGQTPESIRDDYPSLTLTDIYAVIAYYLANRNDVDGYVREVKEKAEQARVEAEAKLSPQERERRATLRALAQKKREDLGL